jgi:transmembrane sensor
MQPTRAMVEQAALWQARLDDEGGAATDRSEFDAWCAIDPLHAVAFERIQGIDARLRPRGSVEQVALRRMWRPKSVSLSMLAFALLAGALGWLVPQQPAVKILLADYRTEPGAQLPVALADGSKLLVDTDSAVDTHVSATERRIELLRGEIHAEVAQGRALPFIVQTADGTARALGTAYTVRKNAADTIVTVLESSVEVCAVAARACTRLAPGQRARIDRNGVERLADIDTRSAGAWTRGWLAVEEMPLPAVLAELNRYRRIPIVFEAATLARIEVSGHFPLRDTDRALTTLARSLPLVVDRSDPDQPHVRLR